MATELIRLRHKKTGTVVQVSAEKADRLDDYERVTEKAPAKTSPAAK